MKRQIVRYTDGKEVLLNAKEKAIAAICQKQINEYSNALGFEISITTLTQIIKSVTEQKFYQIKPSLYMPVIVGEGAWSSNLVKYRSFILGDDFETGIVNTGSNNTRLAEADAGIDSISIDVINWAKAIAWSIPDLAEAARSGNWDLITAKERSRKMNWDLGIQKTAFLGIPGNTKIRGLLNLSGVTSNTSLITGYIHSMAVADFSTFVGGLIGAYRTNCNRTAMPTHFIIPELDYTGLTAPTSSTFPIVSYLKYMEDAFKVATQNPNFKILPCSYADKTINSAIINKNRYVLLNYDADSIAMNIPVDYTATLANSVNNYQWQNVGYGQFSGVAAYRPLEVLYLDF